MTDSIADRPLTDRPGTDRPAADHRIADRAGPTAAPTTARPLELPDRRVFWGWVWENVRPVVGWVLAALGALALFLGWFGVSGQALTAKQLPYLVSGGLVGIALIIMAGVFLATEDFRRQVTRLSVLERKVDDLLALLTTDEPVDAGVPRPAQLVALPTGTVYHRADCTLVAGKPAVAPVDAAAIAGRDLAPCRVCDPPPAR